MGLENPLHIAIILVVILLVFGAKRLPEMGKGLGEGMRGFKDSLQGQTPEQPSAQQASPQLTAAAAPVAQPTSASEPVAAPRQ